MEQLFSVGSIIELYSIEETRTASGDNHGERAKLCRVTSHLAADKLSVLGKSGLKLKKKPLLWITSLIAVHCSGHNIINLIEWNSL